MSVGVTGLTFTYVKGYGRKKGHTELYRGSEYEVDLLPKTKIEIAVSDEKADEVVEAINNKDWENLNEELGDLLLQVVYHSQIAHELGMFEFHDVVKNISTKMISRHPHIFGNKNKKSYWSI